MTGFDPDGAALHRRRLLASIAIVGPVAIAVAVAALGAATGGPRKEPACWILPNARVLALPDDDCPLRLHAQIRMVRDASDAPLPVLDDAGVRAALGGAAGALPVAVSRRGRLSWTSLPIVEVSRAARLTRVATAALVAAGLLGIPLFLVWSASSRAAVPFALFYAIAGTMAVTAISGRDSHFLARLALLAACTAPAVLTHLSLVFPRERKLVADTPVLVVAPYLLVPFLAPAGWAMLDRDSLLWPTFATLLVATTAGTWFALVASSAFAIRESSSAIERARARTLCFGSLLLPLLPTLILSPGFGRPADPVTTYLWSSAILMPLPIGLAISRYNLFDLGWDVRRWVGRLVYFSAAALVIVGAIQLAASASGRAGELPSLALIFLAALPCVGLIEGLRRGVLDLLESVLAPRLRELRRLRESFGTHLARLGDEDAIAEHLLAAARAALSPRAGCVFLAEGGEWRPCLPFGANPATRVSVAEEAEQLLGGRSVVHLELEEPRSRAAALKDRGIEVVASIASGGERFGVLTLGSSDRGAPYTGLELEFVAMAASQVGSALRSARLTRRLLEVERAATRERVAVALAHDLGKDLDWLTRLARRLPSRLTDPKRLARDAALIREFADGLRDGLQDFVRNLGEPAAERRGLLELGDLVEDAIARVSRLHGPQRVTARVDPSCRHLSVHPNLRHVVTSLLDNALHASAESEPVQVVTMLEGSELVIQVADAGAGIPEKLREEVFRAGFTTRAAGGGLGVGLTVCRELVEAAGGSLRLVPNRGGGTRAIARVPRPGAETGPNTPCADA